MKWRRPHWRERPSHPEDDLRPHEAMRAPTLIISSRALARGQCGSVDAAEIRSDWRRAFLSSASQLVLPTRNGEHAHSEGARALVAGTEGTADAEAPRS